MAAALPDLVQLVRKFICDFPKANELRGIAESTDEEIAMYAMMALDDYNTTPPPIANVAFEQHPSTHLLILGTVCHLLLSKGILQFRNTLSYNDGGIAVNIWDKGPAYVGNAQFFAQLWESKKIALKRSINAANGFGVVQSAEFNIYNYTAFYGGDYVVTATGTTLGGMSVPSSRLGTNGALPDPAQQKTRTSVVSFGIDEWRPSMNDPQIYEIIFMHNLKYQNVELIVNNDQNMDMSQRVGKQRSTINHLIMTIPAAERFAGDMQAYIPGV